MMIQIADQTVKDGTKDRYVGVDGGTCTNLKINEDS